MRRVRENPSAQVFAVVTVVIAVAAGLFAGDAGAQVQPANSPQGRAPITRPPTPPGLSQPLRNAPPAGAGTPRTATRPILKGSPDETEVAAPAGATAPLAAVSAPGPIQSFDGLGLGDDGSVLGENVLPPDTDGEVGPNNYVQAVNDLVGVYSKTGAVAPGFPKALSSLFAGTGGTCELHEEGDPVVLYDQFADRWLISYMAFAQSSGKPVAPFDECVAVSTTGDPTGSYYQYTFLFDNSILLDYPKIGVWPDGYYMTVQEASAPTFSTITGMGTVAFDRSSMLAGHPAGMVRFDFGNTCRLLPSDVDGSTLPPAGSPNYIVSTCGQAVNIYKFHADFVNTASSSLSSPTSLTVAYDPNLCNGNLCIPQPGTRVKLDTLSGGVMFRAAYRNFGDHQSIVINQPVDVDGTNHAGVQWFELRDPGGTPSIFQHGSYAPDSNNRWMGSIAQDHSGDIAVGYSVSSTSTFPSIRYAARLSSDALGTLGTEASLMAGGGSQTSTTGRWGDYTALTVDPSDDCTFWYTSEYLASTAGNAWRTRIGSFRLPGCAPPAAAKPPADFDGNGTTDISVFRPSTGEWLIQNQPTVSLGLSGDIPVPCDYDGNGTTDEAVFRPSTGGWYVNGQSPVFLGGPGDVPVPADYNGDGKCEMAVFRPSVGGWYVLGQAPVFFGLNGDIPVPGDYDGNGTTDVAVFRPSVGGWYVNGAPTTFLGLNGDVPVPGDYDGNGTTDVAVFRPSVGGWYVNGQATQFLGLNGDVPVPGEYNGNGTTDVAVFRPSTGAWFVGTQAPVFFGLSTDIPLPLPSAIRMAAFP